MEQLKTRGEALGKATKEQSETLAKKYQKEMQDAATAMMPEMMRISMNPQLAGQLKASMQKMTDTMIEGGVGGPNPGGK
jgi:hypothetical protein